VASSWWRGTQLSPSTQSSRSASALTQLNERVPSHVIFFYLMSEIPSANSRLRNQFDTAYPSKSPSGMIRQPSNFQTQILHLAVIQICHLPLRARTLEPIQEPSHLRPNSFWQPPKVKQCQVSPLSLSERASPSTAYEYFGQHIINCSFHQQRSIQQC
jgi:hypothetical protein